MGLNRNTVAAPPGGGVSDGPAIPCSHRVRLRPNLQRLDLLRGHPQAQFAHPPVLIRRVRGEFVGHQPAQFGFQLGFGGEGEVAAGQGAACGSGGFHGGEEGGEFGQRMFGQAGGW